jgi:hypothetical protein
MERTKKQEKAILIKFLTFLILVASLAFALVSYILPEIREIEQLKSNTTRAYQDVERVKKE